MKKPAKLLLRKEMLRTLAGVQLARAAAGAGPALAEVPTDLLHCVANMAATAAGG